MSDAVRPSEVFERAAVRAASLRAQGVEAGDDALERLRAEAVAFFEKVPEPPVYRRADDPLRGKARALLEPGEQLLARLQAVGRAELGPLEEAVKASVETLCHTAAGRIDAAEHAWRRAEGLERQALSARRLWSRSDEQSPPIFDRRSGASRFDPRPDPTVGVKLACPSCRYLDGYAFSPRQARVELTCKGCQQPFAAYLGESRGVEVETPPRGPRRYLFRIEELEGGHTRLELEDGARAEFSVARRDLLAFLYDRRNQLRGVLNLSTGRLLWLSSAGCFLATAAFGAGAPELRAFRAFRERVLLPTAAGRWGVAAYYRHGPWLSRVVARRRWTKALVKGALVRVHRRLEGAGF